MKNNRAILDRCVEDLATFEGWSRSYSVLLAAGTAALKSVSHGMTHRDPRVRMWCASFMDHFADETCLPALLTALEDPVADVRRHALHSLGCRECKPAALQIDVVPLLIKMALRDSSIRIRRAAAHLLGNHGIDPRVVAALTAAAKKDADPKFKSNARWAIGRASPPQAKAAAEKVGRAGLEPATKCLKGACSTIELTTRSGKRRVISQAATR